MHLLLPLYTGYTKKRELLKTPTKIEEIACSAECDRVAFCRACNTHRVTQQNGNFWNA